jgi:nicotinamidase-related amidase
MPGIPLIIIDMLNDFFVRSSVLAAQRQQLVSATNTLICGARQHGHPVIWIRQEFNPDLSDSFMEMRKRGVSITIAGTEGCEIIPELNRLATDTVFVKKRYSAFFGTGLEDHLAMLRPDSLILCGINTHACVRTTAIDAYQRDYQALVAAECVASYDTSHHDITIRYLVDSGIARVLQNNEILRSFAVE